MSALLLRRSFLLLLILSSSPLSPTRQEGAVVVADWGPRRPPSCLRGEPGGGHRRWRRRGCHVCAGSPTVSLRCVGERLRR